MSEYRAILVSEEAITEIANIDAAWADETVAAFDAAGDQPRKRVCATHPHHSLNFDLPCDGGYDDCRVVDAIVCVLEEES